MDHAAVIEAKRRADIFLPAPTDLSRCRFRSPDSRRPSIRCGQHESEPCAVACVSHRRRGRTRGRQWCQWYQPRVAQPSAGSVAARDRDGVFSGTFASCSISGNSSFNSFANKSAFTASKKIDPIPVLPLVRHLQCMTCVFMILANVPAWAVNGRDSLTDTSSTRSKGIDWKPYNTEKSGRCNASVRLYFCVILRFTFAS